MTRGRKQNQNAGSTGWLGAGGRLAHLLLVLFALRAIIPVGYMPDPSALQDGRFEIVVCTPAGLKTITVSPDAAGPDTAGADQDAAEDGAADDLTATECPFQTVIAQALVLPDRVGIALSWASAGAPPVGPEPVSALRPVLLGSPLGPRAPPISVL